MKLGPRPHRTLPRAPHAPPSRRQLALEDASRPIDRAHRPSYAVWELTLACDLACRHCGSRAGRARPDELDTAQALDLVDQMAELGVKEISLIGGEAYLREDWLDVVRRARSRGILVQMTTGARGLTRDRMLAARDAGLMSVSISVDGFEATHDALRGVSGSFRAVERTFADLRAIEPYQVLETHPMLVRAKRYGDTRGVRMWPGNNIGYFGPFEHVLRGDWRAGHRGTCGAGRSTLGIEANGDIKGCPSLSTDEFVGGNVRDVRLVDIWERSAALRFTRDITKAQLGGYCAECYYAEDCYGGCHWTASVLTGHIGDNPYCHHRAVELLHRGERERIELAQAVPGLPFDHAVYRIVREPWPSEALRRRALEITETGEGFLDV
ncbi:MAG: radical SAM protein [Polyangiales bacterium]